MRKFPTEITHKKSFHKSMTYKVKVG